MSANIQFRSLILLLVTVVEISTLENPIHLTEPFKIAPYYEQRSLYSNAGLMATRQCGGPGRDIKARHEKCTTGLSGPCIVPASGTGRSEIIFVPSRTSRGVTIRTTVTSGAEMKQYENSLPDVSLEAGKEFSLTAAGGAADELKGRHFTSQVEILRESDKQLELCMQWDFIAV